MHMNEQTQVSKNTQTYTKGINTSTGKHACTHTIHSVTVLHTHTYLQLPPLTVLLSVYGWSLMNLIWLPDFLSVLEPFGKRHNHHQKLKAYCWLWLMCLQSNLCSVGCDFCKQVEFYWVFAPFTPQEGNRTSQFALLHHEDARKSHFLLHCACGLCPICSSSCVVCIFYKDVSHFKRTCRVTTSSGLLY